MSFNLNSGKSRFFTREVICQNAFESVQNKGLINKIIGLFDKFHPDSNYRFWLASCVEAFLRGFNETHQIFIAHSGLLYSLLDQVLNQGTNKPSNIQISYDLIGEIVKFNKYNVVLFENICQEFSWSEKLSQHALTNVIDSNVFLRALLLSFEKFHFISGDDFNEGSKLYELFSGEIKRVFQLIIESIDATLINQDSKLFWRELTN